MGKSKYARIAEKKKKVSKKKANSRHQSKETKHIQSGHKKGNGKGLAIMMMVIIVVSGSIYGIKVAIDHSQNSGEEGETSPVNTDFTGSDDSQTTQDDSSSGDTSGSYQNDRIFTTIEGESFSMSDHAGKVIVFFFFYLDCYYCELMEPELHNAQNQFESSDLLVIAIDVQPQADTSSELLEWRNTNGYNWKVVRDTTGSLTNEFQVTGTPKTVYFDGVGAQETTHYGYKESPAIQSAISSII